MPILDVAIGLSLYYLMLGLICSTANEMIAGFFNTRSLFLERGIDRLLGNDSELKRRLLQHPLITSLASKNGTLPSYIPSTGFAVALLDTLSGPAKSHADVAAVMDGAKANPALQGVLLALADSAKQRGVELKVEVAEWFDHGMDRVTGWYKRNAQRNTLVLAAIITLALNANTISVGNILWTNPTVRAAMVEGARARAEKAAPQELPLVEYNDSNDATASTPVDAGVSQAPVLSSNEQALLGRLGGWSNEHFESSPVWWLRHLLGWIITILAASLGAPFWFDTLKRFVNIRSAGNVPAKSDGQPQAS
jgi:hypothetical protein